MSGRALLRAFLADAVILHRVSLDDAREHLLGLLIDEGLVVHMDVEERVALSTYKMGVGLHMSVEAVGSVGGNLDNLAQVGQQRQVAVDGAEADIRKFFFYMQIDGICGGVVVPGQEKAHNGFSLTAVF